MLRIIFIILIFLMMTGCGATVNESKQAEIGYIGEKEPVTRAEAAKMLALCRYTPSEINNMERTIKFEDTTIDKWYDKYINAAYNTGLIAGTTNEKFSPEDNLTLKQARILVKKLNTRGNFDLQFNDADKDKPISYKIWLEAFTKAAGERVRSCNIFVYATGNDCSELGDKYILCNGGLRGSEGVDISAYRDNIINVVMKDTEILGVVKVVNQYPVLENSEITDCGNHKITVKLNGAERSFNTDNSDNKFKKGDKVNIAFDKDGNYRVTLNNN